MSDLGFTQPDLSSIRAATQQPEFADAVRGRLSADGYLLAGDHPLAPLAGDAARALVAAGFTLHHHDRYDLLHLLHGVCLVTVRAESGTPAVRARSSRPSVTCCWIGTGAPPAAVPGSVLHAVGYLDRQCDAAGTRFVAGYRGERTGAAR